MFQYKGSRKKIELRCEIQAARSFKMNLQWTEQKWRIIAIR